jgi:hypothetical protein
MTGREGTDPTLAAALAAYRAAARSEADAHFDEPALEAQRQRILQRIEQAGQRARVLHFPTVTTAVRPAVVGVSRRWISAAAVAGLLIGLGTGQLLHVMPGDNWVNRDAAARPAATAPAGRLAIVPAVAMTSADADDALLDAIDVAVTSRGASELRALDDLTFVYEPR